MDNTLEGANKWTRESEYSEDDFSISKLPGVLGSDPAPSTSLAYLVQHRGYSVHWILYQIAKELEFRDGALVKLLKDNVVTSVAGVRMPRCRVDKNVRYRKLLNSGLVHIVGYAVVLPVKSGERGRSTRSGDQYNSFRIPLPSEMMNWVRNSAPSMDALPEWLKQKYLLLRQSAPLFLALLFPIIAYSIVRKTPISDILDLLKLRKSVMYDLVLTCCLDDSDDGSSFSEKEKSILEATGYWQEICDNAQFILLRDNYNYLFTSPNMVYHNTSYAFGPGQFCEKMCWLSGIRVPECLTDINPSDVVIADSNTYSVICKVSSAPGDNDKLSPTKFTYRANRAQNISISSEKSTALDGQTTSNAVVSEEQHDEYSPLNHSPVTSSGRLVKLTNKAIDNQGNRRSSSPENDTHLRNGKFISSFCRQSALVNMFKDFALVDVARFIPLANDLSRSKAARKLNISPNRFMRMINELDDNRAKVLQDYVARDGINQEHFLFHHPRFFEPLKGRRVRASKKPKSCNKRRRSANNQSSDDDYESYKDEYATPVEEWNEFNRVRMWEKGFDINKEPLDQMVPVKKFKPIEQEPDYLSVQSWEEEKAQDVKETGDYVEINEPSPLPDVVETVSENALSEEQSMVSYLTNEVLITIMCKCFYCGPTEAAKRMGVTRNMLNLCNAELCKRRENTKDAAFIKRVRELQQNGVWWRGILRKLRNDPHNVKCLHLLYGIPLRVSGYLWPPMRKVKGLVKSYRTVTPIIEDHTYFKGTVNRNCEDSGDLKVDWEFLTSYEESQIDDKNDKALMDSSDEQNMCSVKDQIDSLSLSKLGSSEFPSRLTFEMNMVENEECSIEKMAEESNSSGSGRENSMEIDVAEQMSDQNFQIMKGLNLDIIEGDRYPELELRSLCPAPTPLVMIDSAIKKEGGITYEAPMEKCNSVEGQSKHVPLINKIEQSSTMEVAEKNKADSIHIIERTKVVQKFDSSHTDMENKQNVPQIAEKSGKDKHFTDSPCSELSPQHMYKVKFENGETSSTVSQTESLHDPRAAPIEANCDDLEVKIIGYSEMRQAIPIIRTSNNHLSPDTTSFEQDQRAYNYQNVRRQMSVTSESFPVIQSNQSSMSQGIQIQRIYTVKETLTFPPSKAMPSTLQQRQYIGNKPHYNCIPSVHNISANPNANYNVPAQLPPQLPTASLCYNQVPCGTQSPDLMLVPNKQQHDYAQENDFLLPNNIYQGIMDAQNSAPYHVPFYNSNMTPCRPPISSTTDKRIQFYDHRIAHPLTEGGSNYSAALINYNTLEGNSAQDLRSAQNSTSTHTPIECIDLSDDDGDVVVLN